MEGESLVLFDLRTMEGSNVWSLVDIGDKWRMENIVLSILEVGEKWDGENVLVSGSN